MTTHIRGETSAGYLARVLQPQVERFLRQFPLGTVRARTELHDAELCIVGELSIRALRLSADDGDAISRLSAHLSQAAQHIASPQDPDGQPRALGFSRFIEEETPDGRHNITATLRASIDLTGADHKPRY